MYKHFVLDCDGVLWHGDELIPGALEAVQNLRKLDPSNNGRRRNNVIFVTNNSVKSRRSYLNKFHKLGFNEVELEHIHTSASGAARLIKEYIEDEEESEGGRKADKACKSKACYVIGESGVMEELSLAGLRVVSDVDGNEQVSGPREAHTQQSQEWQQPQVLQRSSSSEAWTSSQGHSHSHSRSTPVSTSTSTSVVSDRNKDQDRGKGGGKGNMTVEEFRQLGASLDAEEFDVGAVVVAWDRGFNYSKICKASLYLQRGALLAITNKDAYDVIPSVGGWPGAGTMAAAIEASVRGNRVFKAKHPDGLGKVGGKPSGKFLERLMEEHGFNPCDTLMIGDRLDTDIAFGKNAGVATALVLTGVSSREDIGLSSVSVENEGEEEGKLLKEKYDNYKPDHVFENLLQCSEAMVGPDVVNRRSNSKL